MKKIIVVIANIFYIIYLLYLAFAFLIGLATYSGLLLLSGSGSNVQTGINPFIIFSIGSFLYLIAVIVSCLYSHKKMYLLLLPPIFALIQLLLVLAL